MAHLGNTVVNGALRVIGGENVDTINGVTVGSSPKFTDTNNAVTQTATTTSANYEVLFSATADNTTRTEGARKNNNLLFNPSTGNLQATQLNGVTIGSSPKFTDASVTASSNHYTPATASGQDKTASATGGTAAWSIDVVKGVTLNTDGKGHVTAVSVTSGKIPANPIPSNNITGSGTNGYIAKFNGTNTITNGPAFGSDTTTYLRNDGSWATPTDTNNAVTQTATTTDANYEILFSQTADDTTRTEGARKTTTLRFNPSLGALMQGNATVASGSYSHAEGTLTYAYGASSHAEGHQTTALNNYSHAEGLSTSARGNYSHAEGHGTSTYGSYNHSEGEYTLAGSDNVTYAHSEGYMTSATNSGAHTEGNNTKAWGLYTHTEGGYTSASGSYAHAEGRYTKAGGLNSHAEGYRTLASGDGAHAEGGYTTAETGGGTVASGNNSHAEGFETKAIANNSHAEGFQTTASCDYSHTEGRLTITTSGYSAAHAEGNKSTAGNNYAHAEGDSTKAMGANSHTEGSATYAGYQNSHAEGYNTSAMANQTHAEGHSTCADNGQSYAMGHRNAAMVTGGSASNTNGTALAIGNGTSATALKNAFSVQFSGAVKAASTITASTTADYAEYFEWYDENPNNEDRVGYFVTFEDSDKIRIATPEDEYILGIVSGEPFVLGNGDCDVWNGMVMRDAFRRTIYEPAPKYDYLPHGEAILAKDKDGKQIYEGTKPKYNPNYDPTQKYINRADRPEWSAVGMLGVLAVRDNGQCQINGYCTIGQGGIAVPANSNSTHKYRVIKRNANDVVEVVFR